MSSMFPLAGISPHQFSQFFPDSDAFNWWIDICSKEGRQDL